MMSTQPTDTSRAEVIGRNIRAELARADKTQTELGTALGIGQRGVSRRLAGEVRWTIDELFTAARYLDVQLADLLPTDWSHTALTED